MSNPSVLVAGYTTRHVVVSAAKAGYDVYSVDHFCDQDLLWHTKDHLAFDELDELPFRVSEMLERHSIEYLVTTSGAELLDVPKITRMGTSPEVAKRFMSKDLTQIFFEEIGVPVPRRLKDGEYPAMMKTISGAGGWRNAVVTSDEEKKAWEEFALYEPYIMQEVIIGQPASVSCICTKDSAVVVSSNEQILRGGDAFSYAFSGSVTPCSHPLTKRMIEVAEVIAKKSGCIGSIGIDFVLTDSEAYAIEVNPRFQGTVETVELSTGLNLFELHMNACNGVLPKEIPKPKKFAVRRILTAPHDILITTEMNTLSDCITDIPHPGTEFLAGEVMFSVLGTGKDRAESFAALDKNITTALQHIKE